jgi:hypothetical protein
MPTVSNAARVTSKDGAVWRTCTGCGVLAALPPDIDRCAGCQPGAASNRPTPASSSSSVPSTSPPATLLLPRMSSGQVKRHVGTRAGCRRGGHVCGCRGEWLPLSPKADRSRDRRKVLQYDHVDPDHAARPDGKGLVVACGACNEYKGHRNP